MVDWSRTVTESLPAIDLDSVEYDEALPVYQLPPPFASRLCLSLAEIEHFGLFAALGSVYDWNSCLRSLELTGLGFDSNGGSA